MLTTCHMPKGNTHTLQTYSYLKYVCILVQTTTINLHFTISRLSSIRLPLPLLAPFPLLAAAYVFLQSHLGARKKH